MIDILLILMSALFFIRYASMECHACLHAYSSADSVFSKIGLHPH